MQGTTIIGRNEERERLEKIFFGVLEHRSTRAIWITGKTGVGKTTLIEQVLSTVKGDLKYRERFGSFIRQRDVLETDCRAATTEGARFTAFSGIESRIQNRKWISSIVKTVIDMVLSVFSIGELKDKAMELGELVRRRSAEEIDLAKEEKDLRNYIRELKSSTSKRPLFIVFRQFEKIDKDSAALIDLLLRTPEIFHGVLIFEQGEKEVHDADAQRTLEDLVRRRLLAKIYVKPFNRAQVRQLIQARFGQDLFDSDQLERFFKTTEGIPRKIEKNFDDWVKAEEIIRQHDKWVLADDFENRILYDKRDAYLSQVRSFLENDDVIDEAETKKLKKIAHGLSDGETEEFIQLAMLERKKQLTIKCYLRKESFGNVYRAVFNDTRLPLGVQTIYGFPIRRNEIASLQQQVRENFILPRHIESIDKGMVLIGDHVHGTTLKQLQKEGGVLSTRQALIYAHGIARALEDAEAAGIVHGLLIPENILLTDEDVIKVSGWGINIRDWAGENERPVGNLVHRYFSPEVKNGAAPDLRSNIYSLGVILHEMIYGITSNDSNTIGETLDGRVKMHNANDALQRVLEYTLENDPNRRYHNYRTVIEDLDTAIAKCGEEEEEMMPPPPPGQETQTGKKKPVRRIAIAAGVCILACLLGMSWKFGTGAPVMQNTVLVGTFVIREAGTEVDPGMLEFIIHRHLLCENGYRVLANEGEMASLNVSAGNAGKPKDPHYAICGEVSMHEGKLLLAIDVENHQLRNTEHIELEFLGVSELLATGIDSVMGHILPALNLKDDECARHPKTAAIFTTRWGAFKNFMVGLEDWNKLESDSASRFVRRAIQSDSSFGLGYLLMADIQTFRGNQDRLKQMLALALANKSRLIPIDLLKLNALIANREGRVTDQQENLMRIRDLSKWDPRSHYELAESYFHVVEVDDAIKSYQKAIQLNDRYALAYNHLGYCYSYLGDNEKALAAYRKYISIDSTANAYDSYGDGLMYAGKYGEAISAKLRGINSGAGDVGFLYGSLSHIYLLSGCFDSAAITARKQIEHTSLTSDTVQGHFRLGLLRYIAGDLSAALQECNTPVKGYKPDRWIDRVAETEWLKGLIYFQMKDKAKLKGEVDSMRAAMDSQAINANKYRPLYKFYLDLRFRYELLNNEKEKAITTFKRFEEIKGKMRYWSSPFDYSYMMASQAEVFQALHEVKQAKEALQKAIAYNDTYAMAHYQLARMLETEGLDDDARTHYRRFLEIWSKADKNNVWVLDARKKLQGA